MTFEELPVLSGYLVKDDIESTHPRIPGYDLINGDLLVAYDDGTFGKVYPGLAVLGFTLSEEQISSLIPVKYQAKGLKYKILPNS